jgi:DNA processing protein
MSASSDPHSGIWVVARAPLIPAPRSGAVPSDFVPAKKAHEFAAFVQEKFRSAEITRFGVRVHDAGDYPEKLRDAAHPIELLYYQGWWDLAESRCVTVVGTRKPSPEGIARTRRLVRELVKDNFTVVSGLAPGVDTAVHETAIECDGRTSYPAASMKRHTPPSS